MAPRNPEDILRELEERLVMLDTSGDESQKAYLIEVTKLRQQGTAERDKNEARMEAERIARKRKSELAQDAGRQIARATSMETGEPEGLDTQEAAAASTAP